MYYRWLLGSLFISFLAVSGALWSAESASALQSDVCNDGWGWQANLEGKLGREILDTDSFVAFKRDSGYRGIFFRTLSGHTVAGATNYFYGDPSSYVTYDETGAVFQEAVGSTQSNAIACTYSSLNVTNYGGMPVLPVYSAVVTPPVVGYAPMSTETPFSTRYMGKEIDEALSDTAHENWRSYNWALFQRDLGTDTTYDNEIFFMFGEPNSNRFSIQGHANGDSKTDLSGYFCRFFKNPLGQIAHTCGLNPGGNSSYGLTAKKMYGLHINEIDVNKWPLALAQYGNLITAFDGKLRYQIISKTGSFWLQNIPEDASECQIYIDTNKALEPDDYIEETVYQWQSCKDTGPVVHTWTEYGDYDVRLEVRLADGSLKQFSKRLSIDGSNYSGGFGVVDGEDTLVPINNTNDLMANCFTELFPFIDIPACSENIGVITSLLSFNTINLVGKFDATPCKNLNVIDGWMHLENPSVCPMIPEEVRNVTTPFVTSAFGFMMVGFITRQARGKF